MTIERPLFFVWSRGYPQKYSNMAVRKGTFKLVGQGEQGETDDQIQLFNLIDDPSELQDISDQEPVIKADLRRELDQWYDKIIQSPHLVNPPRILIGTSEENPVILGRNDWKSPTAQNWSSTNAFGYWDVTIETRGTYEVKMVFQDNLNVEGWAFIRAGTRQYQAANKDTSLTEIVLSGVEFDPGDHMLEGWYQSGGRISTPIYIEVQLK
jgi:arylsulfatase